MQMRKAKMKEAIQEMLNKNPQIEPCFVPIVEAFLIRLVEQYNLKEEEFNVILEKYNNLKAMSWKTLEGGVEGQFSWRYFSNNSLSNFCKNGVNILDIDMEIEISIETLKGILLGNQRIIQKFINTSFHEQGHFIQFVQRNKYIFDGGLTRSRFYWDKLKWGIMLSNSRNYDK